MLNKNVTLAFVIEMKLPKPYVNKLKYKKKFQKWFRDLLLIYILMSISCYFHFLSFNAKKNLIACYFSLGLCFGICLCLYLVFLKMSFLRVYKACFHSKILCNVVFLFTAINWTCVVLKSLSFIPDPCRLCISVLTFTQVSCRLPVTSVRMFEMGRTSRFSPIVSIRYCCKYTSWSETFSWFSNALNCFYHCWKNSLFVIPYNKLAISL